MFGLSRRWMALVIVAGVLKVLVVLLARGGYYVGGGQTSDFFNWIAGTRDIFDGLTHGILPSISKYGAYTGIMILLIPFYWLWTLLPVPHPVLEAMPGSGSLAEVSLIVLMKIPILLFDLAVGILISRLVWEQTGSSRKGGIAFCAWYLYPYNAYWTIFYGGYDVIPTAVLILAVIFGSKKRWFWGGISLSLAGLLRLFPFFVVPFFLVYALRDSIRAALKFLLSCSLPLVATFLTQAYIAGSFDAALSGLTELSVSQSWLLYFYGPPLANTNNLFRLSPFLLLVQLYLTGRYWKTGTSSLTHFTTASLLVVLGSSVEGIRYHFVWVTPFLAAYFALNLDGLGLLTLTFISAALYPPLFSIRETELLRPLFAGWLYGLEAAYLLKLNLDSAGLTRSFVTRLTRHTRRTSTPL
jgi:hypothetical protein